MYWTRTFNGNSGGTSDIRNVLTSPDGGFYLAGNMQNTISNQQDMAVVKLYGDGVFNYAKLFGGTNNDVSTSISFKTDGGILLGGNTASFGSGSNDAYVLSLYINVTGCLPDNDFIPVGGTPLSEVNEQVSQDTVVNYETLSPSWGVSTFSMLPNSQCLTNQK